MSGGISRRRGGAAMSGPRDGRRRGGRARAGTIAEERA